MTDNINAFINPQSVAVIGATERPGSWGSFIMSCLTSMNYQGAIYPVNPHADEVFGVKAYHSMEEISDPVDLAVLTIPSEHVERAVSACGEKGVKGVTIITAGYGEVSSEGESDQERIVELANSQGMRVLGPNVSGTFNLHAGFNASSTPGEKMLPTPVAAVCQGGYAFYDMLSTGWELGYGAGWFIHTGNESDLTISDFLEHFSLQDDVKSIIMYIEAVRDGDRFKTAARQAASRKPVVIYKAGRTPGSARAANSHTGAMAGTKEIYQGLFSQLGLLMCPTMELLLPVSHALIERPPMKGLRVGIITVGGSWGVALSDALEEQGLRVPELSPGLQSELRRIGLPERASVKNPVDFGASGLFLSLETPVRLAEAMLSSDDIDALVVHGIGRPGMHDETTHEEMKIFLEIEKKQVKDVSALETKYQKPVMIGSHCTPWQSQAVYELNRDGCRVYNRLDDIARILFLMREYWKNKD